MSGSVHQEALDIALRSSMKMADPDAACAAETAAAVIGSSYGFEIYCPSHRCSHFLTPREHEQLVYGLLGDLADHSPEDTLLTRPDSSSEVVNSFCPRLNLRNYLDREMYYEHIDAMLEARQRAERADD